MKTACFTAGGFSLFFTTNSVDQLKSETLEKKISCSNDIVTAAGKIDDEISDFMKRYGNHPLRRHNKVAMTKTSPSMVKRGLSRVMDHDNSSMG